MHLIEPCVHFFIHLFFNVKKKGRKKSHISFRSAFHRRRVSLLLSLLRWYHSTGIDIRFIDVDTLPVEVAEMPIKYVAAHRSCKATFRLS
jgi:hypothetical protein